jgi:hypothetical protein
MYFEFNSSVSANLKTPMNIPLRDRRGDRGGGGGERELNKILFKNQPIS